MALQRLVRNDTFLVDSQSWQMSPICNNRFVKQSDSKNHKKPHTGESCNCNIRRNIFATPTSPKHHTKFHTGDRCKEDFSHDYQLTFLAFKFTRLPKLDEQNRVFQVF